MTIARCLILSVFQRTYLAQADGANEAQKHTHKKKLTELTMHRTHLRHRWVNLYLFLALLPSSGTYPYHTCFQHINRRQKHKQQQTKQKSKISQTAKISNSKRRKTELTKAKPNTVNKKTQSTPTQTKRLNSKKENNASHIPETSLDRPLSLPYPPPLLYLCFQLHCLHFRRSTQTRSPRQQACNTGSS